MARHQGGMFSIKLIHPDHLRRHRAFTDDFDGKDGRHPLMNFSDEANGPAIAGNICRGHRSLVYVIHEKKFIWAIEYTGTVKEGQQAAVAHAIPQDTIPSKWGRIFLPIRFLAKVDLASAVDAAVVLQQAGVDFTPNRFTMKYISEEDYQRVF